MILVHSSPTTLAPYRTKNLGVLCSPRRVYGEEMADWPWAADNDGFSAWDEERYREMLNKITGRPGCLFVTSPDVVGDSHATLELFNHWKSDLREVGQDGLSITQTPWGEIDALFIGGTDEFKMGAAARQLVLEANAREKWVHMGRVNSYERVRYARWLGCDSIDGTQFSWFRDRWLPPFLDALRQEVLFDISGGAP
jgi:hypothetical protein